MGHRSCSISEAQTSCQYERGTKAAVRDRRFLHQFIHITLCTLPLNALCSCPGVDRSSQEANGPPWAVAWHV
jgi:hypothetical protein